ncbi:hypothetical protein V6N13_076755 [Hibiscus sabdariffa]
MNCHGGGSGGEIEDMRIVNSGGFEEINELGRKKPVVARESAVTDMEAEIDEDMAIQQQTVHGSLTGSGNDEETRVSSAQLGGKSYAAVVASTDGMNREKRSSCVHG